MGRRVPYAEEVRRALRWALLLAIPAAILAAPPSEAETSRHGVTSLSSVPVTMYGAKWCGACRALQQALTDRKIAFEVIDIDDNPAAFARARAAANASSAIPLTGVTKNSNTVWIVGAAPDEVERALKD
jgi:mycoredoxin